MSTFELSKHVLKAGAVLLLATVAVAQGEDLQQHKEAPSADEIRQKFAALTKDLSADDFELRQKADGDLEVYIRKTGQSAVDLLARETVPAAQAKGDQEIIARLKKLLARLTTPMLLWTEVYDRNRSGIAAVKSTGDIVQLKGSILPGGLNLVLDDDPKLKPQAAWSGSALVNAATIYSIEPNMFGSAKSLSAYRRDDGKQLWTQDVADLDLQKEAFVACALSDDEARNQIVLVFDNFCVAAFDKDGKRKWVNKPETPRGNYKVALNAAVNASAGRAFVTRADTELVAIDLDSGSTAWKVPYKTIRCQPASEDDRVYVVASDPAQKTGDVFYALSVKDGKEIFHTDINWGYASSCAKVFVKEKRLVASAWNGIYGLDKDGKRIWRRPFPLNYAPGNISVFGDTVYGGAAGEILAARIDDGSVKFRFNLADLEGAESAPKEQDVNRKMVIGEIGAPFVVGDRLYAMTGPGWVVTLRMPPLQLKK
jgi:outer membrane protein assembly factor BamB